MRLIYELKTANLFVGQEPEVSLDDFADFKWPPYRKVSSYDPFEDDPRLAVKFIEFCAISKTLCIGGNGGQVITFSFSPLPNDISLEVSRPVGACIHMWADSRYLHVSTHTHMYTYTCTSEHTIQTHNAHIHVHVYTHTHVNTQYTYTCAFKHTHSRTQHTYIHTHTHTHTHTYTHTHTHTHTHSVLVLKSLWGRSHERGVEGFRSGSLWTARQISSSCPLGSRPSSASNASPPPTSPPSPSSPAGDCEWSHDFLWVWLGGGVTSCGCG